MLLIYYRTYATHALLGVLLGVDDSAVCRNINPLQPLLVGIFRIPERKVPLDPEDIRELFFDATERPTRRPATGQREYYSGKKKRHTIKTRVVIVRRSTPPGPGRKPREVRIAAVSESAPGRVHDKKLYDQSRVVAPPDAKRVGDTAYLGTPLRTPHRKPRGGVDGEIGAGERPIGRPASGGRAWDRQGEGVAGRLGAIPEPDPAAHADHEERGGPSQPDVRVTDPGMGKVRPATRRPLSCSDSIEDGAAVAAAVVEHRGTVPAIDAEPPRAAARAAEAVGVKDGQELGVAGLVH